MGAPPTPTPTTGGSTTSGPSTITSQHERLMLELLPFTDVIKFHEWLQSDMVRGSWEEYCRDFLARNPRAPEPDKNKAAQSAKDAVNSRKARFLMYHPNKADWTMEDHAVRFIVTVVADNVLRGTWSDSEWKKKSIDITKSVYEVLSYLRANFFMPVDPNPPRYSMSAS